MHAGKALKTGPMPGVTRAVQTSINVHTNPKVQVIDTPGVMIPHVDSYEEGMQLALIGALKDNLVGEEYVADYLLYWMNKHGRAECVEHPYSLAK
jgi:ribosome biogenesis GTPase A